MQGTIFIMLISLAILAGLLLLEYFLSLRESWWPGLVLPALCLVWGLIFALSATTLPAALAAFLLGGGLPCLIYLAIYWAGRGKVRRRSRDRVDKMNIQDL